MSFKIVPLAGFSKELKKLAKKFPSLRNDYAALLDALEVNPKMGVSIGKNCYKIRFSITSKGKGKSGGARIITHFVIKIDGETLYLLKIYDKSEQESISDAELQNLLNEIAR